MKIKLNALSKVRKASFSALATLALALGFTLAAAPQPANAALPYCTNNYICLFDFAEYEGSVQSMPAVYPYGCANVPYAWANNMATSVFVTSWDGARIYDGANCTGGSVSIPAFSDVGHNLFYQDFANKTSSVYFY